MPSSVLYALSLHDALPIYLACEQYGHAVGTPHGRCGCSLRRCGDHRGMRRRPGGSVVSCVTEPEARPLRRPDEAAIVLARVLDRKSTRLNSSHLGISYAVFRALRSFPTRRSSDLFGLRTVWTCGWYSTWSLRLLSSSLR